MSGPIPIIGPRTGPQLVFTDFSQISSKFAEIVLRFSRQGNYVRIALCSPRGGQCSPILPRPCWRGFFMSIVLRWLRS